MENNIFWKEEVLIIWEGKEQIGHYIKERNMEVITSKIEVRDRGRGYFMIS